MGYVAKVGDYVKGEKHTYQILAEINKGGFADAYKAKSDDGTIVFLKQYKSPSKLVPWFKPYFSYEAELNRRLKEDTVLQNATVYANEVFCSKVWKDDKHSLWTKNECLFQVFPFISGNTNFSDMIQKGFKEFDWQKRLYAFKNYFRRKLCENECQNAENAHNAERKKVFAHKNKYDEQKSYDYFRARVHFVNE